MNSMTTGEVEECAVPRNRLQSLEDFELGTDDCALTPPMQYKENGNFLFSTCKDWDSAITQYTRALEALEAAASAVGQSGKRLGVSSVGASVLVFTEGTLDIKPGMVSSNDGAKPPQHVDVMYEDDSEEAEVHVGRLYLLCEQSQRATQRACYLNLARCALKKQTYGRAVRYSSLSLAVLQVMSGDYESFERICNGGNAADLTETRRLAADSLLLRSKALLLTGRPGLAGKDAVALQMLDEKKGGQQLREVQAFKSDRIKRNKRLAKDVVEWVQTAMTISERAGAGAGAGVSAGAAGGAAELLDTLPDEDEPDDCSEGLDDGSGSAPSSSWFW